MKNESSGQSSAVGESGNLSAMADKLKRRRVLLGGGVGAILATVKSGSALAGGVCNSPSAFGSIAANPATSHKPHTFTGCDPHSHGWYGNNAGTTNSGKLAKRTQRWSPVNWRVATLADTGLSGSGLWSSDTKLFDIVAAPNSLPNGWQPDGNLIVLWLDVKTGNAGDALVLSDVMAMWDILFNGGSDNTKFTGWTSQTVRAFYTAWVKP
jgi:hypothetical protein